MPAELLIRCSGITNRINSFHNESAYRLNSKSGNLYSHKSLKSLVKLSALKFRRKMKSQENRNEEVTPWAVISKNIEKYQKPSLMKSIWQIINSFIPYVGLWILIVYSLSVSYWLTAFLILLAAGFLVRLFIIFHDCGHGSYFKSTKANRMVGMFLGILAFTPYDKWHNQHRFSGHSAFDPLCCCHFRILAILSAASIRRCNLVQRQRLELQDCCA